MVEVTGEIDLATVPTLTAALDLTRREAQRSPLIVEVVVDLRRVDFLSATGIGEVVRAWGRCYLAAVPMYVVADQRAIIRPLLLTGLADLLGLRAAPAAAGEHRSTPSQDRRRLAQLDRLRLPGRAAR
ncbi:anti-anti-sigma factor [Crossiella equi]|uniref:Anti-anti-sigma factor n=1 Tax=Crossiella equi TaxID=130796 RepID=A0ABS5A780_9PSEU|nr:STAS domain-containing protein [Crossiella equi]MBP2471550.1 anti-anti-sigma factor [Crossiella equi]